MNYPFKWPNRALHGNTASQCISGNLALSLAGRHHLKSSCVCFCALILRTCCPLVDRFPTDTAIVRKPSRIMAVSPNCPHDHSLILPDGKTQKVAEREKVSSFERNSSTGHRHINTLTQTLVMSCSTHTAWRSHECTRDECG